MAPLHHCHPRLDAALWLLCTLLRAAAAPDMRGGGGLPLLLLLLLALAGAGAHGRCLAGAAGAEARQVEGRSVAAGGLRPGSIEMLLADGLGAHIHACKERRVERRGRVSAQARGGATRQRGRCSPGGAAAMRLAHQWTRWPRSPLPPAS